MSEITWDLNQLHLYPAWRGAVDGFSEEWIYGWVISAAEPQQPVELRISLFGEHVLTTINTIFREDISGLLKRPVCAGFSVPLRDISPADAKRLLDHLGKAGSDPLLINDILRIEVADSGLALPLSANLGSIDPAPLRRVLILRARDLANSEEARIRQRDHLLDIEIERPEPPVNILAFYHAQFYPYMPTDRLHGRDLSDWADVAAARPLFEGHAQPKLPGSIGFYDLRVDAVQKSQVELAKHHGLSGFCYDYYWCDGRSELSLPIDRHLTQDYDFGFCLCLANDGLTRPRPNGDEEIILQAHGSYGNADAFIHSCLKYFCSRRYIRIDGAPLLLIRNISTLQSPAATIQRWRKILETEGIPDLHVCMVEGEGQIDPRHFGCDSSCQYPPSGLAKDPNGPEILEESIKGLVPDWRGLIRDYADVVQGEISRPSAGHLHFRTALPGWDDTPRRGKNGTVLTGATSALFGLWIQHLITDARTRLPEGRRFFFIRAWNDWAGGASLEPARRTAFGNEPLALGAISTALMPASVALAALCAPAAGPDPMAATRRYVEGLIAANKALGELAVRRGRGLWGGTASAFVPVSSQLLHVERVAEQKVGFDTLNGHPVTPNIVLPIARWQGLAVRGWFLLNGLNPGPALIALRDKKASDIRFVAALHDRENRPDVAAALAPQPVPDGCGFTLSSTLQGIPAGQYALEILIPDLLRPKHALAICPDISLLIG